MKTLGLMGVGGLRAAGLRSGLLLGAALLLGACGGDKDEDSGTAPPLGGDGGDDTQATCEGTAPVVTELRCENTGIQSTADYGDVVTLTLWASVTDEDGDLSSYRMQVHFDDVPDGTIDTTDPAFPSNTGNTGTSECQAHEATLGTVLLLRGGEPFFDTEYEFGMVITDAGGLDSNLGLVTCYTPTMTGDDGGPGDTGVSG